MLVVGDGLAAEVAHLGAALARHFVASVLLEEGLFAAVASPDQGLQIKTKKNRVKKTIPIKRFRS